MTTIKPSEYPTGTIADIDGITCRKGMYHWRPQVKNFNIRTFEAIDELVAKGAEFEVAYMPLEVVDALVAGIQSWMERADVVVPDREDILHGVFDQVKKGK